MLGLGPSLSDDIIGFLTPHMRRENDRISLLLPTLKPWDDFDTVIWEGSAREFTVRLVDLLPFQYLINTIQSIKVGVEQDQIAASLCEQIDLASTINQSKQNISIDAPFGIVSPNSLFYMQRDADRHCMSYLSQTKAWTIYVKATRQVGKSSLIQQVVKQFSDVNQCRVCRINFSNFTQAQLKTLEDFLIEFCYMISEELGIPEVIGEYWNTSRRSELTICSNYLSQYILPKLSTPLILVMDDAERVLYSKFRNDFFGMVRSWHEKRSYNPMYSKLNIIISSSTEPELFIDNPSQSPFNVAYPVDLHDFSFEETKELNKRHQSPLSFKQLEKLTELLEGHPFLTRLAFYHLATKSYSFNTLMTAAISEDGPFGHHLVHLGQCVTVSEELQKSLYEILSAQNHTINKVYYRLKGAGLVKCLDGHVIMRNKLYQLFFSERLYA